MGSSLVCFVRYLKEKFRWEIFRLSSNKITLNFRPVSLWREAIWIQLSFRTVAEILEDGIRSYYVERW